MIKIVEAVPNFSEGQNMQTIEAIAESIRSVADVQLLHIDRGESANRTVMTFVGQPDAIAEAAFRAAKVATERIDMRLQKGTHPRLGALDVLPFVPISDISLQECAVLARNVAQRVGNELNVPVYCYEAASKGMPHRIRLEQIRKGEYEGLTQKMNFPEWKPDFGPTNFNAQTGAYIIGARPFLLAYNINLATSDVAIAKKIAELIRESGFVKKGTQVKGKFKSVKAIGWYVPEYGCAQISTNLTNLHQTPVWQVYEYAKELASKFNTQVTGSEIIGLTPEFVLLDAGYHYNSTLLAKSELIELAIEKLKLNDKYQFLLDKIIENRI